MKLLNESLLSCCTSDAVATAAKKAAQRVVYFIVRGRCRAVVEAKTVGISAGGGEERQQQPGGLRFNVRAAVAGSVKATCRVH